jgi:hypothetical protein
MTITRKNPVRRAFSECSTGNDHGRYYKTKGHAVRAFNAILEGFDCCLDPNDLDDFHGDEGRKVVDVYDDYQCASAKAVISWYRMPSGRYEFVGYLA